MSDVTAHVVELHPLGVEQVPKKSPLTWVRAIDVMKPYAGRFRIVTSRVLFAKLFADAVERGRVILRRRGGRGVNQLHPESLAGIAHNLEEFYVIAYDVGAVLIENGRLRRQVVDAINVREVGGGKEVTGLYPFAAVDNGHFNASLFKRHGESFANKAPAAGDDRLHN